MMHPYLIVGCAHIPIDLAYLLYAANDLAVTSQNLVEKQGVAP
jgi:hypothetical protein